jgi:hypothetical protein
VQSERDKLVLGEMLTQALVHGVTYRQVIGCEERHGHPPTATGHPPDSSSADPIGAASESPKPGSRMRSSHGIQVVHYGSDRLAMGKAVIGMSEPDEHERYEAALRRLPEAHSLALRLRKSGAADEVICEYLQIEPEGLDTLLELANEKLQTELRKL